MFSQDNLLQLRPKGKLGWNIHKRARFAFKIINIAGKQPLKNRPVPEHD